jgi:hypothetical protein
MIQFFFYPQSFRNNSNNSTTFNVEMWPYCFFVFHKIIVFRQVHRFLELPAILKSLETLIDHVGVLYKFHDRPLTYLYNTLHFYESTLRDKFSLKKKLVSSIVGEQSKTTKCHFFSLSRAVLCAVLTDLSLLILLKF